MTEIEVNRSSHLVDPALQIWGWEIPVYLFLGGMTAGIMILIPLLQKRVGDRTLSEWARMLPFLPPWLAHQGFPPASKPAWYTWTAVSITMPGM